MEKGTPTRPLGIAPRVGTIVLAVIIVGVSAGTICIIEKNDAFDLLRDSTNVFGDLKDLQELIEQSLSAAGWLIALSVFVIIGEAVAITFATINFQPLKLVLQILDILFSIVVAIGYVATGIACAVFAARWGGPPDACEIYISFGDCDSKALTAYTALSTVFSFIQAAVFGFIALMVTYTIVKSRKV